MGLLIVLSAAMFLFFVHPFKTYLLLRHEARIGSKRDYLYSGVLTGKATFSGLVDRHAWALSVVLRLLLLPILLFSSNYFLVLMMFVLLISQFFAEKNKDRFVFRLLSLFVWLGLLSFDLLVASPFSSFPVGVLSMLIGCVLFMPAALTNGHALWPVRSLDHWVSGFALFGWLVFVSTIFWDLAFYMAIPIGVIFYLVYVVVAYYLPVSTFSAWSKWLVNDFVYISFGILLFMSLLGFFFGYGGINV